ncbi:MAG: acyclic terpene utilization AtuA family protein [Geminicoccaceae bacterium]
MSTSSSLRLGTGAGFSADRLEPAVDLVARGRLDAIVFECIGERTLAFGHRDRMANPEAGYNPLLERRLRAVLPLCVAHGTRLITNMGVANPRGAAAKTAEVARALGLRGLRIAALEGDDVSALIGEATPLPDSGITVGEVGRPMVGANAYLGADAILPALDAGAEVVITGRVADPSLFLAPLRHAFGWAADDWPMLGAGTLVGHLMECAAQVTGGYFADPGRKEVPGLAYVGFPIAEVAPDGRAVITKLADAGGLVSERTVKEQLLYEVHDPAAYVTPDVVADFSRVEIRDEGADRVAVGGADGRPRPAQLKVTVAFDGGLLAEAGISYAGPGAKARAALAGAIVEERMRGLHGYNAPLRIDLIGVSALHASALAYPSEARDVRLRAALRARSREQAELLLWEVESLLCCGPAGGGGYRGQITPSVITHSAYIDRARIRPRIEIIEA